MYLKRDKTRHSGFTLVEIMVVVVIVSIISAAVVCTFVVGKRTWFIGSTQVAVQQAARNAISRMTQELTFSSPLKIPNFSTLSGDTIAFHKPASVNANGDITWSGTIQYSLNTGQIVRTMGGQTGVLANNITALQFTPLGSQIIGIGLTAQQYTLDGRDIKYSLNSQVYLRNE